MQTRRYGEWASPLSASALVAGARGFSELALDGDDLYWLESRPDQGGRNLLMRRRANGDIEEMLDERFNVRSRVHEYGGGALTVADGELWFTDFSDQRLYHFVPGTAPVALAGSVDQRFADAEFDPVRGLLYCVMEHHSGGSEPTNSIVALRADRPSAPVTLYGEADFVASPALSPDGRQLAFIAWRHPDMPWDNTSLILADLDVDGAVMEVRTLNAGMAEAVMNPLWHADGTLYFISDRDDWWNLYRYVDGRIEQVTHEQLELGRPAWNFNIGLLGFISAETAIVLTNERGREGVGRVNLATGRVDDIAPDIVESHHLVVNASSAWLVGGFADRAGGLVRIDPASGEYHVIRESSNSPLPAASVSLAEVFAFTSSADESAYGFYYPPKNPDFAAPASELPPLIVLVHGGPTAHSTPALNPRIQFWTTRGFAVLDLNYRGSTGFGRRYRHSLNLEWGEKDVADAVNGANQLAARNLADPTRLLIRGGSAGGFTVLAAHAFHNVFAAGANYYGVSDMEALAHDTHKFESRYLDQLVGPYPEQRERYRARSPINALEGFSKPLIVLQGQEDKIVPPSQSEAIVHALQAKGIKVEYLSFPGEQHGFRKAENIIRAIQAELNFYGAVLGFEPAA